MATNLGSPQRLRFRQASVEMLTDFLTNLNERNKDNLRSLSTGDGDFKDKRLFEYTLLMCQELRLDLAIAYHAVELLQRFMVKHITHLLTPGGSSAAEVKAHEDAVFEQIRGRFALIVFSCVQLASKLSLHSHIVDIVDINKAVRFLRSIGFDFSKQAILESELMVLKGLQFQLDPPNPLTYVEILLEVLGHNEPSAPVERLHQMCRHVLQFVSLQRDTFYDTLLSITAQTRKPTAEQREKFVPVTEDCMLLGVGVIATAAFILHIRDWEQVVQELSHITGISTTSIRDFTRVTLTLIVGTPRDGQ
ncbi:cyclin N-terminal domain-containing protein 1 [Hippocampus zosterae]|uniref:cyclin N-terminal domain-containing protein 1 n=1 Tax=Hippocampus zosterae TaxID=109293 RepID=UPI00223D77C5|nr:cyclin N-terminal domain-containing protein 1 [Hippocampus zosterae]